MVRLLVLFLALVVCPATAGAQSFASIFTQLPKDFTRLAEPASAIILGSAGASSMALHPKDDEIARRANDPDDFFMAGDLLGEGVTHAAAGLAVYVTGRVTRNTVVGGLGSDLLRAQLVSGIITDGLKLATDRVRPDGGKYSFPSGHTSTAFASASVLQEHFGWKVGVPSYVVATYVASSRMAHNRHFISDVVFGAGIGIAAGRATTFHVRENTVRVAPTITRNSAAITLSITN
jgi:membrane-associated phospholipid phosphatase